MCELAPSAFQLLEEASTSLGDPYVRSSLQKWGMRESMRVWVLRRFGPMHKAQGREIAQQIFSDSHVIKQLQTAGLSGVPGSVMDIDVLPVPCTTTRMDVFDKLAAAEPPIVRESGDIVRCFDDYCDDIQISDLLRGALLKEDSEHADLFSEEEKAEFLFRIFYHLCVGGGCCQFEDNVATYLDITKKLYKDLLSVQKSPASGRIEVASSVYRINNVTYDNGATLFPKANKHNFCYLIVDPIRRLCKVWYCPYAAWW